ncbi:hypothetical protein ACHAP5_006684 [Fusarium lateritium]
MKFATATLLSFAAFAKANFDLYLSQETGTTPEGGNHEIWNIYPSDPTCSDVETSRNWFSRDDVSSRTGIRCSGQCFGGSAATDINVLEMHFTDDPLYHFTIYKDRNYDMYGLDGQTYGNCFPFPGNEYSCHKGNVLYDGVRKFRCITDLTVDQIEAGN